MCGISAYFGPDQAGRVLTDSIGRLDYRGYDSAGMATAVDSGLEVRKGVGDIENLKDELGFENMGGNLGIAHTRWATHGDVTKRNAHPHLSCDGRFAIVHNGILENWREMRRSLNSHEYASDTDSEVIAHFLEENVDELGVEGSIRRFMKEAEGNFAVVVLDSEEKKIFGFRRGSPLVLGLCEDAFFLTSDVYAFSPYTHRSIFLENGEYVVIDEGSYIIKDGDGRRMEKEVREVDWNWKESSKEEFDHFMRKEIEEIPQSIERLELSLSGPQRDNFRDFCSAVHDSEKVIFTASGTSYHASLLGVYFLNKAGMDVQTLIASEFENYERVDDDTLVIAVSQSGETRDVLDAINYSKEKGADVASIVNVPHSSAERESDLCLRIEAGQEVCVAATKTFTNQLYLLLRMAEELGCDVDLSDLPGEIAKVIEENEPRVAQLSKELHDKSDIYIIGRGETYPVAREIALKLKEISYLHAEGMMGGELKHGTLALIEDSVPVLSLIPERSSEILSNVEEVEARGAISVRISPWEGEFEIPEGSNGKFSFFATVVGFLLAYWIARRRNLPIDKPRNLAKTLTVR